MDGNETYTYAKAFKNAIFTPIVSFEENKTVLETIINRFYYNAITGKIDIEAEWDKYVEEWLENGGKEVLYEARQIFASYNNHGY